uniref:CLEC16A_C domain-containing protein n=1 Tax=Echinostoma caproni TaxID=27848 RepID=A0A183B4T2_9TREM
LSLDIEAINEVLCDQLLHRLFIPLLVYSLTKRYKRLAPKPGVSRPHVSNPVATLMLLHAYLIIGHPDLIRILTEAIFLGDPSLTDLVSRWNQRSPTRLTSTCRDSQDLTSERSEDEGTHSDCDALSDDANPAIHIAESLVAATLALRSARSAAAGKRLTAYMESGRSLNRHPAFLQPSESLEACLRHARGVTPALLASLWPSSLEPLALTDRFKCESEHIGETPVDTGFMEPQTNQLVECTDPQSQPPTETCAEQRVSSSSVSEMNESFPRGSSPPPIGSTPRSQNNKTSLAEQGSKVNSSDMKDESEYSFSLQGRPFLRALYRALEVGPGTDYDTLFTLLLLQAIRNNKGEYGH